MKTSGAKYLTKEDKGCEWKKQNKEKQEEEGDEEGEEKDEDKEY